MPAARRTGRLAAIESKRLMRPSHHTTLLPLAPRPRGAADGSSLPPGRWRSDAATSTVGFSVAHLGTIFSATFECFDVRLDAAPGVEAALTGTVAAGSLRADDPALAELARSPALLDAGRHPELSFVATDVARAGEHLELDGRLTIKRRTLAVTALGTLHHPHPSDGLRLQLETRIDRRQFGLEWAHAGAVLGTEVRLVVDLRLIRASRPSPDRKERPCPPT